MINKKKKEVEKLNDTEDRPLSTKQVLKEIGNALTREKIRREKVQKRNKVELFKLDEVSMIKPGESNFEVPMPSDLATLKSLIQTIVRHEIGRDQDD